MAAHVQSEYTVTLHRQGGTLAACRTHLFCCTTAESAGSRAEAGSSATLDTFVNARAEVPRTYLAWINSTCTNAVYAHAADAAVK